MYASEYINYALHSELSPLNTADIGGANPTADQLKNKAKLISCLNLAVLEVHKVFGLIQKEYILENATNNSLHAIPVDFLYAVSAAFDDGCEVGINDERQNIINEVDSLVSVLFPAPFKALIKGTDSEGRNRISIVYAAAPPKVTTLTDYIDLQDVFLEPILNYMAFKAYVGVSGDMQATNNTFYLRFKQSCEDIKMYGLTNPDNLDSNQKLTDRGFP